MPGLSDDQWRTFLDEPAHLARIATVDADGMPRVLPLWFIIYENRFCFTPRRPAVIWHNLVRDPRAGVSIVEDDRPWRKVVLQGHVEVLHPPGEDDAWRDLYRRIAARYVPQAAADAYVDNTSDQPRALCAIDLAAPTTRLSTWRMPIEGEDPRGIWHPRYYT